MATAASETGQAERRAGGFFGRRKGKSLRPRQQARIDRLLPILRVDIGQPCPSDLGALFGAPLAEFHLEIGCGGGEHLAGQALANPAVGFIGVEPFVNGLAQILARIENNGLANIRLFDEDAARLLDWLPAACLSRIELLFPDPWPKRRHAKRRFVSRPNLDRIVRTLAPGGEFRFASDAPAYVNWTLGHCLDHAELRWLATGAQDWRLPWPGWQTTRYQAKAIRQNRPTAFIRFEKIASSLPNRQLTTT